MALKIECPECHVLGEPAWVRGRADGQLDVKCGACGIVSVCGASKMAPPAGDLGERKVVCPKCGHRQHGTEACDRCGVVFARYDALRAAAESDEAAQALWGAVDKEWDDDKKHGAFLEYCSAMGLFAYAAQQYGVARRDPARAARAARQIARLVVVAENALAATKPGGGRASIKRLKTAFLVVTFVICATMLLYVLSRFRFW